MIYQGGHDQVDTTIYLSSFHGGGAHKMMINIANGLSKQGYNIDLAVVDGHGELSDMISNSVQVVDFCSDRILNSIPKLIKYMNDVQPKTLLASPTSVTLPAIWAKFISSSDTKIVLRIPEPLSRATFYSSPSNIRERLLPVLIKNFYPHSDDIIAISNGVAEDLVERFGINRNSIDVIYNPAVNDDTFNQISEDIRHSFFTENEPVFIGVGRLVPAKNFGLLIDAFAKVNQLVDSKLIILGDGELEEDLEQMVSSKGLSDSVCMPGFVDNPLPYMRRSDTFVLSSSWEGFGNVIVESLACGTPVIATDCPGGPSEILRDGEFGTLVPPNNKKALSKAMLNSIHTDSKSPKQLQKRAKYFHIDRILEEYKEKLFGINNR